MDRHKFLKEYQAAAREQMSSIDIALVNLLLAFDEEIAYLYDTPYWFHKAFRQVDVVSISGIDSAIWNLLYVSTLFWEVFDKYIEKEEENGNTD